MVADKRKGKKTEGRSKIYKFLSFSLTVVFCGIVIYQGPKLKNELQRVDFMWAGAGLGCYFINYLLRALRIRTISKGRISYWPTAVYSACLHGFASYMLPLRSGDLTLPVILNNVSGLPMLEGGRLLVKARLLDLSMLGFWAVWAVVFTSIKIVLPIRVAWLAMGIVLCMTPIAIKWISRFGENRARGIIKRIASVGNVGSFTWKEIFQSLAIWAAVGFSLYCTVNAVGLPLGIGEVWFIISINLPLQLIPIQGFANTGNHEAGWVGALALLGISASEGLRFALTSHALLLSYVLALWPLVAIGQIVNMKKR